ncbi:MAG: hypothetical protein ACYCUI_15845 [Vulcanimicrobiaceae bacterium]
MKVTAEVEAANIAKYHAGEWKMDDIGLDGSWLAHRNSAVGYYTATDVTRGKIICEEVMIKRSTQRINGKEVVITKGNYNGTSKGMQGEGCRRLLNRLEREQLLSKVKTITTDSDSSVVKILAEDEQLSHIEVTMPFLFTCTHTLSHTCMHVCVCVREKQTEKSRQGPLHQGICQAVEDSAGQRKRLGGQS